MPMSLKSSRNIKAKEQAMNQASGQVFPIAREATPGLVQKGLCLAYLKRTDRLSRPKESQSSRSLRFVWRESSEFGDYGGKLGDRKECPARFHPSLFCHLEMRATITISAQSSFVLHHLDTRESQSLRLLPFVWRSSETMEANWSIGRSALRGFTQFLPPWKNESNSLNIYISVVVLHHLGTRTVKGKLKLKPFNQ